MSMSLYISVLNKINSWEKDNSFPAFDCENYENYYNTYPLFMISPSTNLGIQDISLSEIYGDNWAFEKPEKRGFYPKKQKLLSLLSGYTNYRNIYNTPIPPIPLIKINSKYFCSEGNHRIYLSKILNRKTIQANVHEFDYESFLINSELITSPFGSYLSYQGVLEEISEVQALFYQKNKENLIKKGTTMS